MNQESSKRHVIPTNKQTKKYQVWFGLGIVKKRKVLPKQADSLFIKTFLRANLTEKRPCMIRQGTQLNSSCAQAINSILCVIKVEIN